MSGSPQGVRGTVYGFPADGGAAGAFVWATARTGASDMPEMTQATTRIEAGNRLRT